MVKWEARIEGSLPGFEAGASKTSARERQESVRDIASYGASALEASAATIHIPVDLTTIEIGPMQPGEPSWIAWKCGRGPRTGDIDAVHPAVEAS